MSAELTVEALSRVFVPGTRPAVDRVGFTVTAGEIVVLLGPSGCGKTTTLRMVAGLEKPTEGMIAIGGRVVSRPSSGDFVAPQHREIGMVFQSYAVWPHMTVFENVAYPLRHRGFDRAGIAGKVGEALELVGLQDYAARSVVALSGGQMQRVALARALVYRPQILLLDEPLSNLDAKLRVRLRDDLRRIIKDTGVTALYVTHDQAEAVVLGDRIGVMRDGKLLQMSSPVELYNRPVDPFVANFTGASNLLHGRVARRSGELGHIALKGGGDMEAALPSGAAEGDQVQVAVRPENLSLGVANGPGAVENRFTGRVESRSFQGNQCIYTLRLLGTTLEAVELGTMPRFAIGADVAVTLPPHLCWAFPAVAAAQADAYADKP